MSKVEEKLAAEQQTIEISVRSFYLCKGGAVSPTSSAVITFGKGQPTAWAELVNDLLGRLTEMEQSVCDLSRQGKEFSGMRPMTANEVMLHKDEAKSPTHETNMARQ